MKNKRDIQKDKETKNLIKLLISSFLKSGINFPNTRMHIL